MPKKGKSKKDALETPVLEAPKKGKAKKEIKVPDIEQVPEVSKEVITNSVIETKKGPKKTTTKKEIAITDEPGEVEYETVKKEWAILCEQINVMNEERESLEVKKNQLLQKLCKLGESNMPKGENIFNINSKSKGKIDITNTILENDSDSSDSSDSDSDSDDEPIMIKKKPIIKKTISDSDSDSD